MKSKKNSKRENRWLKCRQQIRRTGILLMGMLLVSTSAYASEPIIVTGTRTLLAWAAGICTSFVSAFTIYKGSVRSEERRVGKEWRSGWWPDP